MGPLIKIDLVHSNEEYTIVKISANNLVLWQKRRTSEVKKSPKLAEIWGYEQLLGNLHSFFIRPVKLDPRLAVLKIFMIFVVYCS